MLGNIFVLQTLLGQQHDARTLNQPHAGQLGANQLRQLGSLLVRQNNLGGNSHSPSPSGRSRPLETMELIKFHQE
ncbi:hypothetical protein LP416_27295 [Polaromonas sp. P2-4]|nr:hypothetical protein LP416_27295 [Polaromonas sp. P2-4]